MQNWNPEWSNYCLLSNVEWFFLCFAVFTLLLFLFYPVRIRRYLLVPCLIYFLMGCPEISALTVKMRLPKKPNPQVHFALPEYETGWKVSLAGVATPTSPTFLYSIARSINFGQYSGGRCVDLAIHDEKKVLSEIKAGDLVCVTAIVSNYLNALSFTKKAKERGAIVAMGGPWASVRAKQIYLRHPEIT